MKRKEVEALFREFVETELAGSGFVMRAPLLAERTAPGLRQGVVGFGPEADDPEGSMFTCATFWAFTNELDDTSTESLERYRSGPVNGGYSGAFGKFGGSDSENVRDSLRYVVKRNVPFLNRFGSIEKILQEVERYPGSASNLLGNIGPVALFNHAYCLETVGRWAPACHKYLQAWRQMGESDSEAMRGHTNAACRRTYISFLQVLEMKSNGCAAPSAAIFDLPTVVDTITDPLQQKLSAEFMKAIMAEGLAPMNLISSTVTRAIESFYEPRPTFWRDIEVETVLKTLDVYAPDLKSQKDEDDSDDDIGGYDDFAQTIEMVIRTRQLEEKCAEFLLSLPAQTRTISDIYDCVAQELERQGDEDGLELLELDGHQAIRSAIVVMQKLVPGSVHARA